MPAGNSSTGANIRTSSSTGHIQLPDRTRLHRPQLSVQHKRRRPHTGEPIGISPLVIPSMCVIRERSETRAVEREVVQGTQQVLSQAVIRVGTARPISNGRDKELSQRSSRHQSLESAALVHHRLRHARV